MLGPDGDNEGGSLLESWSADCMDARREAGRRCGSNSACLLPESHAGVWCGVVLFSYGDGDDVEDCKMAR